MDEFGDGMNKVNGLFGRIKANPLLYEELFVDRRSLRMAEFMEICTYVRSDEGTNKRQKEDETIYAWELLLLSIEGNSTIYYMGGITVFVRLCALCPSIFQGFHFVSSRSKNFLPFTLVNDL